MDRKDKYIKTFPLHNIFNKHFKVLIRLFYTHHKFGKFNKTCITVLRRIYAVVFVQCFDS